MKDFKGYPEDTIDPLYDDDGTMPNNVKALTTNIVGRKIVSIDRNYRKVLPKGQVDKWGYERLWDKTIAGTALVLDDGRTVLLQDTDDCCAYTSLTDIIFHLDKIDHVIMGVGTTDGYTKWHIYADLGDVMELEVGWSCGNPFYYGYGFDIYVIDPGGKTIEIDSSENNE